jgi:hypothetical protein
MYSSTRNLSLALAVLAISLIGTSAYAAGSHFGGAGAGGFARSAGSSSFSHVQTTQSRTVTSVQPHGPYHTYAVVNNPNGPNPPIVVPRHPCPPYHMHYPVWFWFGRSYLVNTVEIGGIDVQFTSIRQLDAGDPSKNLAPAYRVWFTNNTDVDINQPFDVAILAANSTTLSQGLPYAAVRVDGMAAGETMSADIRLPIEAMSMTGNNGQPAAFTYLHTIVDSQNELVETNKQNNLAVFARQDIPMLGN